MSAFTLAKFFEDQKKELKLKLATAKKGLERKILIPKIQKPGLALIGDTSKLHPGRLQILGRSEMTYLESLSQKRKNEILKKICKVPIAGIVIAHEYVPDENFIAICQKAGLALLISPIKTAQLIQKISQYLEQAFQDSTHVHGVLLEIYGIGVLITGKSGVGKSECALDLINRGHSLVADDVIKVERKGPQFLVGSSEGLLKNQLEIRGLGILDIGKLFGIAATADNKTIDLIIEFVTWNPQDEYDRLGITDHHQVLLDIAVPFVKVPVSPGRNLSTIVEVAARNQLLKKRGIYTSKDLIKRLDNQLKN